MPRKNKKADSSSRAVDKDEERFTPSMEEEKKEQEEKVEDAPVAEDGAPEAPQKEEI